MIWQWNKIQVSSVKILCLWVHPVAVIWFATNQSQGEYLRSVNHSRAYAAASPPPSSSAYWAVPLPHICSDTWNCQKYSLTCLDSHVNLEVKLSPKSNQGFICDWICVKPLCKCIILTKEELLKFTVVSFLGKLIFNGVQGHFYASIKIVRLKQAKAQHNMKLCL